MEIYIQDLTEKSAQEPVSEDRGLGFSPMGALKLKMALQRQIREIVRRKKKKDMRSEGEERTKVCLLEF